MKRFLLGSAMAIAAAAASATDVGVSVRVGEPGFYGRLDLGSFPEPQVIYSRPVIIERAPVSVAPQPIYLRVPPGHAKHWSKHCRKYHACGQPVYFVRDQWYNNVYVPHYHEHGERYGHEERGDRGEHGRDHHDHEDHHRGHDEDGEHGRGHGHGRGHDRD